MKSSSMNKVAWVLLLLVLAGCSKCNDPLTKVVVFEYDHVANVHEIRCNATSLFTPQNWGAGGHTTPTALPLLRSRGDVIAAHLAQRATIDLLHAHVPSLRHTVQVARGERGQHRRIGVDDP